VHTARALLASPDDGKDASCSHLPVQSEHHAKSTIVKCSASAGSQRSKACDRWRCCFCLLVACRHLPCAGNQPLQGAVHCRSVRTSDEGRGRQTCAPLPPVGPEEEQGIFQVADPIACSASCVEALQEEFWTGICRMWSGRFYLLQRVRWCWWPQPACWTLLGGSSKMRVCLTELYLQKAALWAPGTPRHPGAAHIDRGGRLVMWLTGAVCQGGVQCCSPQIRIIVALGSISIVAMPCQPEYFPVASPIGPYHIS